ncbi:VRR-NUC domain-containing protein [Mycena epipterygia]|nr:VRR-NUC domain-containing protein [Mycena epipterygia]
MSGRAILDLLYGGEASIQERDIDEIEQAREIDPEESTDEGKAWARPSLYVAVFERAINNIKKTRGELSLFTEEEWYFLDTMVPLEYHSRFILIRLVMRKPGQWYRLASLQKYTSEVGPDGLLGAFEELCQPLKRDAMDVDEKDDGIIDLTLDSDDEDTPSTVQPVAGPSNLRQHNNIDDSQVRLDYFCQDERELSTLEGLRTLTVPEIKPLCKIMKIKHTKLNKDQMITALINHSATQSILPFTPSPKSKGKGKGKAQETGLRQTTLPFAVKINCAQTNRLRALVLKATGKCIRLNPYIHTLMIRLHIIWFRSTEYPDSLFRPALFAGFNKQIFAEYEFIRDPDIWPTRERYLEYETALQVEATIDDILKPDHKSERALKTPAPAASHRFITPGTPGLDFMHGLTTPARMEAPDEEEEALDFDVIEDTPAQQKARLVKKIFEEHVLEKWRALVSAESETETMRKPGLERFEPGYVYTRMMGKCAGALSTLKEYAFELEVREMLLAQRLWRTRSRAGWYDRRALLQMTYLYKDSDGTKNMEVLREARDGIIEALGDDDTATVMRPSLIRRLDRVEKMLKMTAAEKAKYDDVMLKKPDEISFKAIRVWDHPDSVKLDGDGKVKGKENKTADVPRITNYLVAPPVADPPETSGTEPPKKNAPWRWKGKSLWMGKDGPVNVETRALLYYEELGFQGFHSETQILTTLFGLLFWDIIFANVPGAFETPWQTGPLDIAENSFYRARRERIENRLTEIRDGQAQSILKDNDERHRELKRCCIGISWEMCGQDELVQIVECLGGNALASICHLFCEDYGGRRSGVPDLIVWNSETKECKFVEVKGPGDSLQENQKLWSDALLTAGCSVEVCHVLDSKLEAKKAKKTEAKQAKKTPKPRGGTRAASGSTSRAKKGKTPVKAASVKSDSEDEEPHSHVIDLVDDDEWVPSTEIRDPLPSREPKRRRRTDDDDELPVFTPSQSQGPTSTPRRQTAIARKWSADIISTTPPKKRKTI